MFSYYGSKSKIVGLYPKPKRRTIIEPFAGSAQYAFKYWDRDIILVEKYERIYNVWEWLIEEATPEIIIALPLYKQGDKILHTNQAIKDLIGLECNRGAEGSPRPSAGKYNRWSANDGQGRKRIADNLHKIKHWKIIYGDYTNAPDIEATWFVDLLYNDNGGLTYRCSCLDIDFDKLAAWCLNRRGQTIVCEALGADWLPFEYLVEGAGQSKGKRKHDIFIEAIWTNDS